MHFRKVKYKEGILLSTLYQIVEILQGKNFSKGALSTFCIELLAAI